MNGDGGAAHNRVVDGRFELIERLGSGGMGTVWRARDTVLHREVALKEVRSPDPAQSPEAGADADRVLRERVLREARALARLSHPHVVTIHHIVDAAVEGHPWLVMELLPGHTLQDRLAQGPLDPREAARLGRQVLSALRAAHAAGIQHRDVKPANVMLREDGSAVLTDFGIAALQGTSSLTATGDLIGSPEYIAPERIRGTDDDPASDLWSLGLVLYVAVEGVSPLRRATTLATLAAVLDEPVPPPVRSGPLAPVLAALLVRDPAARPDAARLDALLGQVESGTAAALASQPTRTSYAPTPPPPPTAVDSPRPVPLPGRAEPGEYGQTSPYVYPYGEAAPPPQTRQQQPGGRSRTPVLVAVIGLAVALVAGTALLFALGDPGGEGERAGGGGPEQSRTAGPGPTKSPAGGAGPDRTKKPANPAKPKQPTRKPSRTQKPPPASGSWVAQLFSEPVSTGTAARDRRVAKIRETVPNARFVRSDNYASLRPGYWVIYAPGPFSSGRAALRHCAALGRTTPKTCVGRYLSRDRADFPLQCRPPAANPTGRCTRD
ncbi:serine/threonine-protein kinase [Streptomyces sp. B-S-A8]|uniref:non-specific serine/threonine protein kinase n=1 Tax=Streptomyces solicavernae TaxID=3043614 RepID=A0ABT6RZ61_9ACTN|nr:serine/threonine-protein kinase [Streptomyces sp. B-S-A8]MDI3389732.1 serine/threonine-protein kinase [Streptomyces sp. B-S-A8]